MATSLSVESPAVPHGTAVVAPSVWKDVCAFLRTDPQMAFDMHGKLPVYKGKFEALQSAHYAVAAVLHERLGVRRADRRAAHRLAVPDARLHRLHPLRPLLRVPLRAC